MFRVSFLVVALCDVLVHTSGIKLAPVIDMIQENKNNIESEPEILEDVTYGNLGTFSMGPPWRMQTRPIPVPRSPDVLFADLLVYSRDNPDGPFGMNAFEMNISNTNFDPLKQTVVIVHGEHSNGYDDQIQRLKTAYLDRIDANVIVVNWGPMSSYTQTVSDIRVIGAMVAYSLHHLVEHHDLNLGTVHLIGHGLGAHLCSYAASDVGGVGRVTGLDPSEMLFEHENELIRLDPSDAAFVDVLHTNARPSMPDLAFGIMLPAGHVDYYMYGGYVQPGCGTQFTAPLSRVNLCSHQKSIEYLIEMFGQPVGCQYEGYQIPLPEIFENFYADSNQGPRLRRCVRVDPGLGRSRLHGVYEVYPVRT